MLPRGEEVGGSVVTVVARVWHVLLRYGGEVRDGVGNRVGAAEGEDKARIRRRMREGYVATGVGQEGPGIPCLPSSARYATREPEAAHRDQLECLEVAVCTAARALERLLYAQARRAYAVRYVDDARQLLELPEELLRDQRAIAGARGERLLRRIAADTSCRGDEHDAMHKEA
jgi:hypothetical protein